MRTFLTLSIFCFFSALSSAQETADIPNPPETPRDVIVEEVISQPEPQLLLKLRGASETADEPTEPVEAPEPEPEPEKSAPETEKEIRQPDWQDLAPFYLSAHDYVKKRGSDENTHLVLEYTVETSGLGEENEPSIEDIQLIFGSDYAAMISEKSQKIYDFKMKRFLEIKTVKTLENESETALFFDNVSLYAKAYRNISTVRQATENGKRQRIRISEDQEIDSFWLESSMSWAAAELENPLTIKSTKSNLLAIWDDLSVVSASFDSEPYETDAFKNALFSFAHHAWPIHPKILIEFYKYDAPPSSLEMVSFGPTQPKGQKQKWALKSQDVTQSTFPLPLDALSVVERRPISPLVFVISEAVENRAMGGMPSLEALESDVEKAGNDGDVLAEWLGAQRYSAYSGHCREINDNPVCLKLSEVSDQNGFSSIGSINPKRKTLSDYISATEMAKFKKNRGTALFALQPYLNDADTPAFILRTAAMARASMKKMEAKKAGLQSIQAEALLKQALAKDPYDPHTYLGLAQVYAAKGAFEQSWDIYDVLRAAIPTANAIPLKIDQAEAKLVKTGPGYFLPE